MIWFDNLMKTLTFFISLIFTYNNNQMENIEQMPFNNNKPFKIENLVRKQEYDSQICRENMK